MAALVRWQQQWLNSSLAYREAWSDSFNIGDVTLDMVGHSTVDQTGFDILGDHDIGSPTLDMVGHATTGIGCFGYPATDIPAVDGSITSMVGQMTITGEIETVDPLWLDPPLDLSQMKATMAITGSISPLYIKSLGGPFQLGLKGNLAPTITSGNFTYKTNIIKPLFSVQLDMRAVTDVTGDLQNHTDKNIGTTTLAMRGWHTLAQQGFTIIAPPPYTHPMGSGTLTVIGGFKVAGDLFIPAPPFALGSATLTMRGLPGLSQVGFFAGGGIKELPPLKLTLKGRAGVSSVFTYPKPFERAERTNKLVFEGTAILADPENDGETIVPKGA